MTANYFDRLEAELRAAVPRASPRHAHPWQRWRARRPHFGGIAVALSVAVTVVVVFLAISLHGHRQSATHKPLSHHRTVGPSGGFQYPLGAVPTLRQLLDNFAVLRRTQTPQDRSWRGEVGGAAARQLKGLTRLAQTLPGGFRVFLDVEQLTTPGQLNTATGSYVLNMTIVDRSGNGSSISFLPSVQYNIYPLSSMGTDAVWASVVPDGVAEVLWTFGCSERVRAPSGCGRIRTGTYTVPVVNNVAAARIPIPGHTPGHPCAVCARPPLVTWISPQNQVVAHFGLGYNLPAPPFVVGGQGYRVLRVLQPNTIGGARLGEQWGTASGSLQLLLGSPSDANVSAAGCGVDHESVWTSPAVADPLAVFERHGRFVGYQYGAPVNEIGLQQGPGAVLSTPRGLTIVRTVGEAKRLYGSRFVTSAAGGGTWRVRTDGGTLRGAVLPISYPLRTVSANNRVATIQVGMTGCQSSGG